MRTKSFILTFLMMMFCSVSFGQNTNPDWGEFNYHDYAMNMEVIAKISLDGEAQTSTSIQVAAYCGNERRSEVMKIKQTPGGSLVQLQVFGVKGFPTDPNQTQTTEKITFKFYDGTSMFVSNEDMDFKGNHVVGDLFNPFTIEFKSVAKIGDVKYGSLDAAINAAQAYDVIVLLADVVAETNPVNIPADITLNLNTHTIKADILGTVKTNNGLWVTSDGYKMIGKDADIYASYDATVVNTLVNNVNTITIAAGDVTLAATQYNEWWTAQDQELVIGENVTFTIPQGKKFNIESNTSVTINGTVNNEGTLAIKENATVKGNITGDIHFLGGKYITADNYNMVGTTSDYYYNTTDALVNIAGQFGDITIKSGEMTLGQSWRTVQGQTLTIASGARFTVPANMTFEVFQNTHVIVNGTLVTDGTVYLQLNATVKAAEGLNIKTKEENAVVVYSEGVYKVEAAEAKIGDTYYRTLAEAVEAATVDQIVELIADATGTGLVINKDITVDFGGKTYTINQAVGSTGTESQGFQLLKEATEVTLQNGTVKVQDGAHVVWMINDYSAKLNVTNVIFNCEHMDLPNNGDASNVYFLVANNAHNQNPAVTLTDVEVKYFGSDFGSPYFMEPNTTIKSADANLDIEVDPGYRLVYDATQQTYSVEKLIAHFDGGAYARFAPDKPREHFSINLYDVYASQSLVVKVYHNETLLLTTTYRDYDLDDTQQTSPRYPVSTAPGKGLTVNNVVSGKEAGSWLNVWSVSPTVANVPNKFEVYVDGTLTDTYDGTQNPNAGFSSAENLKTYLGFDGVYKAASVTRGTDVTYYMTLAEAFAAATQNGDIVTLYDNVELTARLNVANNITLNLNNKNITANFEDSYGAIYVKKGAELTLEGEGGITSNNSVAIGTYGTVNIKGGNITSGEGYAALYMFYYQNDYEGTANILGGHLNEVWNCGTLNVSGGLIDYLDTSSELNVTGGVITKMLAKDGSDASGAYEMNIQNIETTVPTVEVPEHFKFVEIRENVYKVVEKVYIAQTETGAKFETLQEAVNAGTTVTLLQPATGAGVVIDKNVTIDFATYTYTVNQAVGSAGTETLGFQILKDNNVTLKNGTLTSTAAVEGSKEIKMLIQNYANLTLSGMNLVDNTDHILYALSNNSGTTSIEGATSITTDEVAFDVYDYTYGGYAETPVVYVNTTGKITGAIEVSESISNNLNISGGLFTAQIAEAWCAGGYIPTTEVVGETTYYTVKLGKYVARNTTTGQGYETLVEAVAAAEADQEVKLLANVTLASSLNVNRNVVLELNGYNIESGTIKAIVISNAQLTVNDSENKGVISAPQATLYVAENAKLIVNSGTIKGASAIQGNGSLNGTEVTINGGKIDGNGEIAIYHPQNGVLNINGGTIVGSAGVEMRAGTLNMTAGTVEVTGTFATRKHDSGQTVDGVAIALSQHTTNHNVDINITGGTIKSSANGKAFYQDRLTVTYTPSTNITADIAATVEGAVEAAELGYNIVENNGIYSLVYVGFEAQIGEVKYETLVEAVEAAQAGETVTLLKSATGAGAKINKNITIDFGGFTYSFNEGVGSGALTSNGFQLLQGNTVVLKNGELNVNAEDAAEFYILVQNYANLTVENMTLDGTNLDKWSKVEDNWDSYTLSNNSGNVYIIGSTIIANNDGAKAFAFDVDDNDSYTSKPVVYVQNLTDEQDNVTRETLINGNVEVDLPNNLNISGGLFTAQIAEAWCAEGYIPTTEVVGGTTYYTVKVGEYVARNTTTGQGYETLRAAVETANAGETITLLQDITLEGGYEDATEGLRIELKGEDYADNKYLTIDGNGKTINCGNYEKGIRIYNENSKLRRLDINNVTIVNNNTNGRCIDTRSGMINLKINNSELTATNGNSQPLTIGGNDEIHRVMLGNTKINAGNSGYGVICFVSTNVDIQTSGNTQIDGYAAFYIKGDDKTVNLNLGQGVYTGKNVHSGESNNFGAVVLEGDNVSVNLYGTNPTVKAIAEGTAPQTAFLVLGENNTITIKSETTQVVTEGDNAYWAMIDADIASSTTIRYGKEIANNQYEYTPILPAAEARGFQFMSLEEAIRFANAGETVTIVNDNTMTATVVVEKNLTIDLNNKTVSYSSTAASPAIRVLADVTVKNGTIKTTNAEGNNYCFIVGQGEKAGKLTIESGLYDASLGGTSVASVTNGELNIEGGEFISKEYNGDHRFLINCIDGNYINNTAKVSIIGGTFHKFNPENNLAEGADTNFCPEGYIAVYDAVNDTYTVKEGVWRAQIGDIKYETVSAAVKAAVDGDVIELLGDVTENFTVGYEATDIKKITIDLKQHTLSSSDLTITINRTGTELTLVNGTVTGNSTGGTIRPTGGGKLILGDDVIVKSGGQAKAIYLHNGHFIVEKDKNVKVYGGIGFLDADNNNNNNEPTVNYISIASGYYQGAIEINDESTCILTGGTYTQDVNEWCADGYVSQNNGDGTWTVRVANYVAAIGETKYESLKAAIDAAQDGNTITVITSHELAETVIVNKNVNIDFATDVELTTKAYPTAFRITEGADVTVVNANIKTVEGGLYNFILGASDNSSEGDLTIKNGTFVANTTVASVTKGNLVIEGGDFSLVEGTTDYRYLINCIDANYINETATVAISGGTFHNWNPQDNAAETGGHANFCVEGYAAVETSTGVWEVVPMQEMKLYAGWNWFSSYIDINGEAGLGRLQEALNPNGVQIKNDGGFTQYTEGQGWFGPNLTSASVKEMYMINMSADHNLQLKGELVDPDKNAITLEHGWNWIGYQLNIGLNLENALAGFNPNHGDRIKSHQGFSQYYDNASYKGWWGTLETMTPGYGYMYYNANEDDATLKYSYPADGSKSELRTNITSENNYWVPASSQYAGNMNIVAMFEADGDNYEIAAFVGGEVRGSARPIYVEPLDAYMFFLTVHGEDVEEMSFRVYDLATGEEYNLNDRMNYTDNAIVGSITEPYIFRGTVGVGETSLSEVNVYPNPTTTGNEINLGTECDTVEVFNALGVKVAEYQNVDTVDALETAGIYVIRITNNGNVQNCRLIVK